MPTIQARWISALIVWRTETRVRFFFACLGISDKRCIALTWTTISIDNLYCEIKHKRSLQTARKSICFTQICHFFYYSNYQPMLFSSFNLKGGLLKALAEMKYDNATDIQAQVIKLTLDGKNIVGQSQTGTGKTAAFLIPLLQKIDTNTTWLQALIMAPTRELVNQIGEEIIKLTKYYRVNAACVYGGASPFIQKKALLRWPNIIVATPGRLLDFVNQKVVDLSKVNYLILDEVDRMLDMGFIRDIQRIRAHMKNIQQTSTFSATISNEIKVIIKEHVPNYEFIKIWEAVTVDKINHTFVSVPHDDKIFNLIKIIKAHSKDKIVIFTQTKRNTKTIGIAIEKSGHEVWILNGNMSQGKRNSTLKKFQDWDLKILVTTDVASRGLNMDNVWLVVNFDVPKESESYIHRIWRTGRAGAHGKAIMLVSPEESKLFADIERTHKTRIQKSDHVVHQDKDSEFIKYRLDKSTDKFGKGRMNPSHWGGQQNRTFNWTTRSPRDDRPKKTYGKPFVRKWRDDKPDHPQRSFVSLAREKSIREDSRWPREESRFPRPSARPSGGQARPFGAKPPFRWPRRDDTRQSGWQSSSARSGTKRPFRGIGKKY